MAVNVYLKRRLKVAGALPREGGVRPDRLALDRDGGDGTWVFLGNQLDAV